MIKANNTKQAKPIKEKAIIATVSAHLGFFTFCVLYTFREIKKAINPLTATNNIKKKSSTIIIDSRKLVV